MILCRIFAFHLLHDFNLERNNRMNKRLIEKIMLSLGFFRLTEKMTLRKYEKLTFT